MCVKDGLDSCCIRESYHGGTHQDDQELQEKLRRVLQDVIDFPRHEQKPLHFVLVLDNYFSDLEQLEFFLHVFFRMKFSFIACKLRLSFLVEVN